jgi:hypothetical protein
MLMGIIQKPTLGSCFNMKRAISTLGFGDIITRDRLEVFCKFCILLAMTINNCQGPEKPFKIFLVILHLNKIN